MAGARQERGWIAAAMPVFLAAWFLGIALTTTPARYSPGDLVLLAASYACAATALHCGAAVLLRRRWPAAALGALLVGLVLVGHLHGQRLLLLGHADLAVASAVAALAYYGLARTTGAHRWPSRPGAASLASAAALALLGGSAFFASPSFRWHLLRHNKLLGLPVYYALAEPADDVCESMWSARSGPELPPKPPDARPAPSPLAPPPNLVVVMIDTLRADSLAAYAGSPGEMPRLDAWSERAAVFTDVLANSSWTRPSVASLFTGLRPEEHGANARTRLPEVRETLAERLGAQGYETAAFVSNFAVVGRQSGFAQGFERFEELSGDPWPYARADRVTDAVVRFVDERVREPGRSRPLFLYVHYLDPHDPYLSGSPPGHRPATLRAAYAAELRFLDPELERLLAAIEARIAGPTYVLVTSDHGEEFGEHGEAGHGHSLFSEVVRIPAILQGPGVEGQRVDARLEGRDLFDLLWRLARGDALDPAAWARDHSRDRRFASVYSRTEARWHRPFHRRVCMRGIERDGYFLIWSAYGPSLELYRREDDPGETRNLIAREQERALSMKRTLDAEPRVWATRVELQVRDETAELLRRLGYAE
jgi:arylsulfatase A-like enzyme